MLEKALGRGVTAAVYQARDDRGHRAAVKLLFPHMAAHEELARRFAQEARIVRGLNHPGIVRIIDHAMQDSGDAYIAFEFLEGETLAERAAHRPLTVEELVELAIQILDALAAAHAQGVVHRDLKPSNVFLTHSGEVKILDFGVARLTRDSSIATGVGLAIGTIAYMAPEQALGQNELIDGRTDLYSLGALLFRLLSGEPVHAAEGATEVLQKTATEPARSLAVVCPALSSDLCAIVDMSLSFAQDARYPDAASMQRDLVAFRDGSPPPLASQARASRELATEFVGDSQAAVVEPEAAAADPVAPTLMAPGQAPLDEAAALIGQTVAGRYRIEALLGTGGMGAVYRAEHVHMRKLVALKVLHRTMTIMPEVVARFEREAVAAARIEHPNVAQARDFGKLEGGSFYLVLEYVEGESLRALLRKSGRVSPERAHAIVVQVASALAAAHRLGIVHRDLKPENILLLTRSDGSDLVKVLDFGIAKLTRDDTEREPKLTQLGAVFGTPEYMSPEQAMGQEVGAKSDMYSLGIMLYELLSGATPFGKQDMMAVLTAHMTAEPKPLPPDVPPALSGLTMELLAKQADLRPSAEELLQRLSYPPAVVPRAKSSAARAWVAGLLERFRLRLQTFWASLAARRLRALGMDVPLRPVLLVALASLGAGMLLVLAIAPVLGGEAPEPAVEVTAVSTVARVAPPPRVEPAALSESVTRELGRIEALPVYKRTYEDWLTLARTTSLVGRYKDSTLAYQAVLSLKASMRDDPGLLRDLKRAAHDPDSFNLVVNLCARRLKQPGIDLLWELWREFEKNPARSQDSEYLRKKLVVLSRRASRELRTAIELETLESCNKLAGAVERATEHADARSIERLLELSETRGCGPDESADCYPCLRGNAALDRALARARSRPAPTKF